MELIPSCQGSPSTIQRRICQTFPLDQHWSSLRCSDRLADRQGIRERRQTERRPSKCQVRARTASEGDKPLASDPQACRKCGVDHLPRRIRNIGPQSFLPFHPAKPWRDESTRHRDPEIQWFPVDLTQQRPLHRSCRHCDRACAGHQHWPPTNAPVPVRTVPHRAGTWVWLNDLPRLQFHPGTKRWPWSIESNCRFRL